MSFAEWMILMVFVVPIVIGCAGFVLCAGYMQMQENQASGEKHGWA